jgi:hypothetical protein
MVVLQNPMLFSPITNALSVHGGKERHSDGSEGMYIFSQGR